MNDIIERAKGTLRWFSHNSLLGQLITEIEETRADRDHWRARALAAEAELFEKRKALGLANLNLAQMSALIPAPRRSLRDILPVWRKV